MPTKAALQTAGWSQADQRGYAVFYDQHKSARFPNGRPWWAVVERPAEGAAMPMPVGELQPQSWSAPWFPDQKYITAAIGKATPGATMYEHQFKIDYVSMVQDRRRAMKEYYDRAVLEAIGQGWSAPDFGDPIPFRLRAIIGVPPQSPKIPEAALAEDPWILGFSSVENEVLARLLELGHEDILTARQSEANVDKVVDLQRQLAETAKMVNELQAEAAQAKAMREKMAHARKAKQQKPVSQTAG